jgi:hypothetical protein
MFNPYTQKNTYFDGSFADVQGKPVVENMELRMPGATYVRDESVSKSSPSTDSSGGSGFDKKDAAKSAVGSLAAGGSAEDALSAGLIGSGNPYAMAGGLALAAFSGNQKQQAAMENARYQQALEQQDRLMAQSRQNQDAYNRMRQLV